MPNHALAVLTGHLARDPELRYINDKPILRFTIGVSTGSIALPKRPPSEYSIAVGPSSAPTTSIGSTCRTGSGSGSLGKLSSAHSTIVSARITVPASRTKSAVRS